PRAGRRPRARCCRSWCAMPPARSSAAPCPRPAPGARPPRSARSRPAPARWCTRAGPARCPPPPRAVRPRGTGPAARARRAGPPAAAPWSRRKRSRARPCSVHQGGRPGGAVRHAAFDLGEAVEAVPEHLPLLLLEAAVGLGVVEDVDLVVVARAPEQPWRLLAHHVPDRAPQALALGVVEDRELVQVDHPVGV